jgi:predicted  nucleic acid-binding Zn-ribbon protein
VKISRLERAVDPKFQQLLLYQSYDLRSMELERKSMRLKKDLSELENRLAEARSERERQRADGKDRQKTLQLAELALRETESKLQKLERRRITNAAQTNALETEWKTLELKKIATEEECLRAMECCEKDQRELALRETEWETLTHFLELRREELKGQIVELENDQKAVRDMLDHLRKGIGKDWLAAYGTVRQTSLPPPYICPLDGLKCTGCHMHLPTNSLPSGNDSTLHRCEFCNRIIYRTNDDEREP